MALNDDGLSKHPSYTSDQVRDAVERSGYPAQGMVVDLVLKTLGVESHDFKLNVYEEWSFLDDETDTIRNIDASVTLQISENDDDDNFNNPACFLRIHLDFLIESKQSELPYVAFVRNSRAPARIPVTFGLPAEMLSIQSANIPDFKIGMRVEDIIRAQQNHQSLHIPIAVSLTKAHRKGKSLDLSGEDVFRGITIPMQKALAYLKKICIPPSTRMYYDIRLVFPIVVLRAPLVQAQIANGEIHLSDTPWVRLVRLNPDSGDAWGPDASALDVVQYDSLDTYVKWAKAIAYDMMSNVQTIAGSLFTGKGLLDAEVGFGDIAQALKCDLTGDDLAKFLRGKFADIHSS